MAVVSHSVANPTHKSIRRRFDLRKSISKIRLKPLKRKTFNKMKTSKRNGAF